jgi:hypothetical protein
MSRLAASAASASIWSTFADCAHCLDASCYSMSSRRFERLEATLCQVLREDIAQRELTVRVAIEKNLPLSPQRVAMQPVS